VRHLAWAVFSFSAWAGCGSSSSPPAASTGTLGPAGGTLTASDGSSVTIPPGALSMPTAITIVRIDASAVPGSGIAGGTAFELDPPGLRLGAPFEVRLSFTPAALPSGITGGELAVYSANDGVEDHAYWLFTRLVDSTHLAAQANELSRFWVAGPLPVDLQVAPPVATCGVGSEVCVDFALDDVGSCPVCQCSDGSECPGSDPTQCCTCSTGSSCPLNDASLCGACSGETSPPTVSGVAKQLVGPNCGVDSDLCFVCTFANPVSCTSGVCCPSDHPICCADGQTCGSSAQACASDAAGPENEDADTETGGESD